MKLHLLASVPSRDEMVAAPRAAAQSQASTIKSGVGPLERFCPVPDAPLATVYGDFSQMEAFFVAD